MTDRESSSSDSGAWLTPEIYRHLHTLVDRAGRLPVTDRLTFLAAETAGDPRLFSEAQALLEAQHTLVGEFDGLAPGSRVGPYQIDREIGRGGMGAVYLASRADEAFDKQVAIKLIRADADGEEVMRRFMLERRILASLEHPNVARLVDAGALDDGRPYIVMEFVDGVPITEFADRARLTVRERIRLLQAVVAGVEHAHNHLVVHRDLKPGNILVTVAGTPKLLDFGIARVLPSSGDPLGRITASNISPGTPRYASPEQRAGQAVGTSADVYALGVIAYELLTGHSPFRDRPEQEPLLAPSDMVSLAVAHGSSARALGGIAAARGTTVEVLHRQLRGDLDAIVMKALCAESASRYRSAAELNDELHRHLDHQPVLARDATTGYLARKFVLRHRRLVASAAAIVLAIALGVAGTYSQWQRAEQERSRAERRFSSVRSLAASVLDVSASLSAGEDALVARDALVGTSLQYLGLLEREANGDRGLLREVAAAYRRVGDVQRATTKGHVGASAAALVTYERALRVSESLARREPADQGTRRDLALSLDRVGTVLSETGDTTRSTRTLERSLVLYKELLEADRTSARAQRDLVQAHIRFADAVVVADPAAARRSYEEAGAIAKGLSARDPEGADARLDIATVEARLRDMELAADPARAQLEEERYYTAIRDSTVPERLEYFLEQFPNGAHNVAVRQRLADLRAGRLPSPASPRANALSRDSSADTAPVVPAAASVAIAIEWRSIPAGQFDMGCDLRPDRQCNDDERPRRKVTLSRPFRLAATETSLGQYRAYASAAGVAVPAQPAWNNGDRQPVVNVTWDQAAQFCAAVGGRLPTEAEWEWSALGGRNSVYPWGDSYERLSANAGFPGRDGWDLASPVGSFPPNGYGLLDMAGNVWEWVADWYGEQSYQHAAPVDPPGPPTGPSRVLRGGAYSTAPGFLRVTQRGRDTMDRRREATGFRCAQ